MGKKTIALYWCGEDYWVAKLRLLATLRNISPHFCFLTLAPKNSEIRVKNLRERPYVNMTLKWLKDLNIKYSVKRIKT